MSDRLRLLRNWARKMKLSAFDFPVPNAGRHPIIVRYQRNLTTGVYERVETEPAKEAQE